MRDRRGGESPPTHEVSGTAYPTREVAKLLQLPAHRVRAYARAAHLGSDRGTKYAFDFRDLLVLKTAQRLERNGIPTARVTRALSSLRAATPGPLSGVRLEVVAGHVIAVGHGVIWEAETGQFQLHLDPSEPEPVAAMPEEPRPESLRLAALDDIGSARGWFELAIAVEEQEPERAYEAYIRALACDPEHVEAMINIGRLCSAAGELARAAAYFRQTIRTDPTQPVAHFNLGVTLHDLGDVHGAIVAYRTALIHDHSFADAHYNLATLLEETGDRQGALKHMAAYRVACGDGD